MEKNTTYNVSVGRRLKRARRSLGITQAKMAEELDICEETFRRMENGDIRLTAERLNHLHVSYNINPEYIVSGTESWDIEGEVEASLLSCENKDELLEKSRKIVDKVMNILLINDLNL